MFRRDRRAIGHGSHGFTVAASVAVSILVAAGTATRAGNR
jgi:hypothetical protein